MQFLQSFVFLSCKVIGNSLIIIRSKDIILNISDKVFKWVIANWLCSKVVSVSLVVMIQIYPLVVLNVIHFNFFGNELTLIAIFVNLLPKEIKSCFDCFYQFSSLEEVILRHTFLVVILLSQKVLDYKD